MFTAGGSYARLSCQQGTDLWTDEVCKLVPFFMAWKHGYGSLQSTYSVIFGLNMKSIPRGAMLDNNLIRRDKKYFDEIIYIGTDEIIPISNAF